MREGSRKAARFFEGYASQFDGIYDRQQGRGLSRWINRWLRASMALRFDGTFATLRPMSGHSVLDIGCGSGRYVHTCLKLGAARVVGIDLSEEMLSIARVATAELSGHDSSAEFVCGDFSSHSFAERFDYGIVMGVLDYVAEPEPFLKRVMAAITQKVVLSFPVAESVWTCQRKFRYWLRRCPLYFYGRKDLEDLMTKSGATTYSIDRIHRDYFVVASP